MDSHDIRPLLSSDTGGWLPEGGLRWIVALALAILIAVCAAYTLSADRSNAAPRMAISEPGTTVLPSVR